MNKADVQTIMATGDNVLTAIAVAKKCKIIKGNSNVYIVDLVNKDGKEKL